MVSFYAESMKQAAGPSDPQYAKVAARHQRYSGMLRLLTVGAELQCGGGVRGARPGAAMPVSLLTSTGRRAARRPSSPHTARCSAPPHTGVAVPLPLPLPCRTRRRTPRCPATKNVQQCLSYVFGSAPSAHTLRSPCRTARCPSTNASIVLQCLLMPVAPPLPPCRSQHEAPHTAVSINENVLRLLRLFLMDLTKFREMLVSGTWRYCWAVVAGAAGTGAHWVAAPGLRPAAVLSACRPPCPAPPGRVACRRRARSTSGRLPRRRPAAARRPAARAAARRRGRARPPAAS